MTLTEKEAQAIVNLSSSHDFQLYMGYLGRLAEHHNEALINAPPEKLEVQQGMTRAFVVIIKQLASAKATLEKYKGKDS